MRILFFTHYFPPEGNAPASRTHEHCKRWVADGHDVSVITSVPNHPVGVVYPGYKNRLLTKEAIDGISTYRVWTYLAANKGTFRRIVNFLSYMISATLCGLFLKRPDVIIATSPQFFCGWAGLIVSKLRSIPLILEIRDLWPDTIMAVGAIRNNLALAFTEKLEHWLYAGATHIVTVGDGYKEKLIEKGVPADAITVITNGVDLTVFTPRAKSDELIERFRLEGKIVCAYVGTLGMSAALETLPKAALILKQRKRDDIVFLLVGDGAEKQNLERIIEDLHLDNIIFAGRQDKSLVPDFLALADICLIHLKDIPLFRTVLPSKLFEAMVMRKPIVLGVQGHAARILENAQAGITVRPENPEDLADAMIELADDPERRETLGEAGYRYVVKSHNRDFLAKQYLETLERHRRSDTGAGKGEGQTS